MTPTTPEPFAYYNVGIEYHTKDKIIFHKEPTRNLEARWWGQDTPLYSAPDIEALTKERDEWKADYIKAVEIASVFKKMGEEYQQAADDMAMAHKVERDQLQKDFNAELSGNAKLREIIGANGGESMFEFANRFVAERDALAAAAKLALDALVAESRTTESNVTLVRILTATTALRRAGVL